MRGFKATDAKAEELVQTIDASKWSGWYQISGDTHPIEHGGIFVRLPETRDTHQSIDAIEIQNPTDNDEGDVISVQAIEFSISFFDLCNDDKMAPVAAAIGEELEEFMKDENLIHRLRSCLETDLFWDAYPIKTIEATENGVLMLYGCIFDKAPWF